MSSVTAPDWLPPEHKPAAPVAGILAITGRLPATKTWKWREYSLVQLNGMIRPRITIRLGQSEGKIVQTRVYELDEDTRPGSTRVFFLKHVDGEKVREVKIGRYATCDCEAGRARMRCVHVDVMVAILAKIGRS